MRRFEGLISTLFRRLGLPDLLAVPHRRATMTRAVLLAIVSGAAVADDRLTTRPEPGARGTPGAVQTSDTGEICAAGYAREHRVWPYPAGKREVFAEYGIA